MSYTSYQLPTIKNNHDSSLQEITTSKDNFNNETVKKLSSPPLGLPKHSHKFIRNQQTNERISNRFDNNDRK